MKPKYNKRTWLNPYESDSTASVIGFDGEVTDLDTQKSFRIDFWKFQTATIR